MQTAFHYTPPTGVPSPFARFQSPLTGQTLDSVLTMNHEDEWRHSSEEAQLIGAIELYHYSVTKCKDNPKDFATLLATIMYLVQISKRPKELFNAMPANFHYDVVTHIKDTKLRNDIIANLEPEQFQRLDTRITLARVDTELTTLKLCADRDANIMAFSTLVEYAASHFLKEFDKVMKEAIDKGNKPLQKMIDKACPIIDRIRKNRKAQNKLCMDIENKAILTRLSYDMPAHRKAYAEELGCVYTMQLQTMTMNHAHSATNKPYRTYRNFSNNYNPTCARMLAYLMMLHHTAGACLQKSLHMHKRLTDDERLSACAKRMGVFQPQQGFINTIGNDARSLFSIFTENKVRSTDYNEQLEKNNQAFDLFRDENICKESTGLVLDFIRRYIIHALATLTLQYRNKKVNEDYKQQAIYMLDKENLGWLRICKDLKKLSNAHPDIDDAVDLYEILAKDLHLYPTFSHIVTRYMEYQDTEGMYKERMAEIKETIKQYTHS